MYVHVETIFEKEVAQCWFEPFEVIIKLIARRLGGSQAEDLSQRSINLGNLGRRQPSWFVLMLCGWREEENQRTNHPCVSSNLIPFIFANYLLNNQELELQNPIESLRNYQTNAPSEAH